MRKSFTHGQIHWRNMSNKTSLARDTASYVKDISIYTARGRPKTNLSHHGGLILIFLSIIGISSTSPLFAQSSLRHRKLQDQDEYEKIRTSEQQVLEALFTAAGGNDWANDDNWMVVTAADGAAGNASNGVCSWYGITCTSEGFVEKVELSDNNLRGAVPLHGLIRMPHLKVLKLDGNSLMFRSSSQLSSEDPSENTTTATASINPAVWEGRIFNELYMESMEGDTAAASGGGGGTVTSSLQYIDLSESDALGGTFSNLMEITSTFSSQFIYFPRLSDLYLSGCRLHGDFPNMAQLATFGSTLERCSLDDNGLTGTISTDFGTTMTNLRVFTASGNDLEGNLSAFGELVKIRHLNLRGNSFTGTIPEKLRCEDSTSGATLLEKLDLSRQRGISSAGTTGLTGTLPSFSQCEDLRRLDLSHNQLGGQVSENFLQSVDPLIFESASLSSNLIEGELPGKPLVRFDADAIDLRDNRITSLEIDLICDSSRSGAIAAFGCDAVLCPPGTYARIGRQEEADEPCLPCDIDTQSQYWGSISCGNDQSVGTESAPSTTPLDTPVNTPLYNEGPVIEKDVLLELYDATGGEDWFNKVGWATESTPICEWYGIQCAEDGTVESIDLGGNNLALVDGKTLPTSLFYLPSLKYLILKENTLFKYSNAELEFFKDIGAANLLEALDLSSTGLSGVSGIQGGVTLNEIHLDFNDFAGSTIPNELYSLNRLRILTMDSSNVSGKINGVFNFLKNLQVFSANDNKLDGSLLQGGYLSTLSTLRLRNNSLTGTLPTSLNLFVSLSVLDLSRQKSDESPGLEGPLLEFSQMPNLKRLDLSDNSLSGPIPGFFLAGVDPDMFEYADLAENSLVSSIPVGLKSIFSKVYLQNNKITSVDQICESALKGSNLEFFGCDAILCSPGTYNYLGRSQSYDNPCEQCNISGGAQFFGSTSCEAPKELNPKDAIELIYSSCGGPNWISSTNWMSGNVPVCQWEGIQCSGDGSIVEISLRSNGLKNAFPAREIFQAIPTLTALALEGNDVDFLFESIQDISAELTSLDLTNTNLASFDGIDIFPNLAELYAGNNAITGEFPRDILKLSNLKRLVISFNNLDGLLPDDIGTSLGKVELLVLHHNNFSGALPSSLGKLSSVHYLELQSNAFSGEIPSDLAQLSELWGIDLSDQVSKGGGFTGNLTSFNTMSGLKRLDLSKNKLEGSIPSDFLSTVETSSFEKLDLSSNLLSGKLELPSILSGIPFSSMNFSDNRFSGISADLCGNDCAMVLCAPTTFSPTGRQPSSAEYCEHCPTAVYWGTTTCPGISPTPSPIDPLPESINEKDILKSIYDSCRGEDWFNSENWMSSENICDWYGVTCTPFQDSVQSLVLSDNNLVNEVPTEVFQLPYLETLILDSNGITVDFTSIKYAFKLSSLDLSSTDLFSVEGIENAPNLLTLDISQNDFQKSIPKEIFSLTTLQQLFMGDNDFRTSIPSNIGDLKNLRLLSCPSSMLTGSIPSNIGALIDLVHINLEDNSLTGSLPLDLENLYSLTFVDASDNTLEGQLPSFSAMKNIRRLDLSNNAFSQSIPEDFLSNVNPLFFDYLDLSNNFIVGEVPSILAHFESVFLQDNLITGLDDELCDKARGGLIKQFGCDSILCPPNTFNAIGRQDSESNPCHTCPSAQYYGSTSCGGAAVTEGTEITAVVQEGVEIRPSDANEEKQALAKLYLTCGGEYWTENEHWMDSNISFCKWKGVECRFGAETVTGLQLGSNNIQGTPGFISIFQLLPNLSTLNLSRNPLAGFNFNGIENSASLSELDLDATGISSIVGIGLSPSLTHISLRNNRISGFPQEIFQMKTLKTLLMSNNQLDGRIPTTFDLLPNLQTLILSSNSLSGVLDGIDFPSSLRILDLSQNLLSNSIPVTFLRGIPTSASLDIDLSGNFLSGNVPGELSRFSQMDLYLQDNRITSIDSELCSKEDWNGNDVRKYGCSGILCPIGHFANGGRQSTNTPCARCISAEYYGTSTCEGESSVTRTNMYLWPSLAFVFVLQILI